MKPNEFTRAYFHNNHFCCVLISNGQFLGLILENKGMCVVQQKWAIKSIKTRECLWYNKNGKQYSIKRQFLPKVLSNWNAISS